MYGDYKYLQCTCRRKVFCLFSLRNAILMGMRLTFLQRYTQRPVNLNQKKQRFQLRKNFILDPNRKTQAITIEFSNQNQKKIELKKKNNFFQNIFTRLRMATTIHHRHCAQIKPCQLTTKATSVFCCEFYILLTDRLSAQTFFLT